MAEPQRSEVEYPIVMPKLGLTMQEGVLSEWRVTSGDEVSEGQILFVVETDKISNEVEAPAAGRITRLLAHEGETLAVGAPIALWTGPGPGGEAASSTAPAAKPVQQTFSIAPRRPQGERLLSTPLARRVASHAQIALTMIAGTGPRGRIQARDVEAAIQRERETAIVVPATIKSGPTSTRETDLRRLIAARLSRSKAEIPHFYLTADVRFEALSTLRQELSADPASPKLSVTAFLTAAVARALAMHPQANVLWRDERVTALGSIGVGVAVDTPVGVMLPVLQGADKLAPYALAAALSAAVARAREGKLRASDAAPATISISNVGMHNVRSLTPIIDPDQTYILGVGAPQAAIRPNAQGAPQSVREVTLTLACDHRAIDGAPAAAFLATVVGLLESPSRLLIAATGSP